MIHLAIRYFGKPFFFFLPGFAALSVLVLGPVSIGLFLGGFIAIALFFNPFAAFLTYVFFYYHPLIMYAPSVSGALAIFSISTHFLLTKRKMIVDMTAFLMTILAVAVFLSAMLNDTLPGNSTKVLVHAVFGVPFYIFMSNLIDSREKLKKVLFFFIFLGVLQSFFGCIEFFFNVDLFNMGKKSDEILLAGSTTVRPTGSVSDPNIYALFLLFTVPITIGAAVSAGRTAAKAGLFALALFIVFGILIGYTRSVYLGLLIIFLVFALNNFTSRNTAFFLGMILLIAVALSFQGGHIIKRFGTLKQVGELSVAGAEITSIAGRYRQYKLFYGLIRRQPLLGIGAGNFYDRTYARHRHAKPGEEVANVFMNIALDSGLIGLSAYIAVLLIAGKNLLLVERRLRKTSDAESMIHIRSLKYAFAGCLISAQAISGNFLFPLSMTIGLASAARKIYAPDE